MKNKMSIDRLIKIAILLSAEKNTDALLEFIIKEAITFTNCDGGTIYTKEKDCLRFHTAITLSKNSYLSEYNHTMTLPPVPLKRSHVCACSAMDGKIIKLEDVYESEEFNFQGAANYDKMNNYRTKSMLVIPMNDEKDNVIGVLQLINALDEDGKIIPFDDDYVETVHALSSLAAVSMNNHRLTEQISELLHSFVKVMATAIDTRSPYNANHSRSMAEYAAKFIEWLNKEDRGWHFEEKKIDPFIMSVWLHDVGKLVIPLEIMDKPTRLGNLQEPLLSRMDIAILMEEIRGLKNPEQEEDCKEKIRQIKEARQLILDSNAKGFLPQEIIERIKSYAGFVCMDADGKEITLLTEKELSALCVQRGTLTEEERLIMQSHATQTARLLANMSFVGNYVNIPVWADAHHEYLDGSGYPNKMTSEQLPKETRLLTILDIYDAMTAEDRPYKPSTPPEKTFEILYRMADEGKLDRDIIRLFQESGAWKK